MDPPLKRYQTGNLDHSGMTFDEIGCITLLRWAVLSAKFLSPSRFPDQLWMEECSNRVGTPSPPEAKCLVGVLLLATV